MYLVPDSSVPRLLYAIYGNVCYLYCCCIHKVFYYIITHINCIAEFNFNHITNPIELRHVFGLANS